MERADLRHHCTSLPTVAMVGLRHPWQPAGNMAVGCDTAGENGLTWKTEIFLFLMCKQFREPTDKRKKRRQSNKGRKSKGS